MHFPLRVGAIAALLAGCISCSGAQISLVDDLSRTVTLPHAAARVVSLAPSITESLFAIGAGGQVVGVTNYCNYPPAASACQRVGGMINPSIEMIAGLAPDLIVISMEGNQRQDFAALTGLHIPVFVTNPRTLDGINRSLLQLGKLTGHSRQAEALVDSLARRTRSLTSARPAGRTRTLLLVSVQPLMAAGAKNFLNEMLETAGAQNIAASTGLTYPSLSRESILEQNPDVILVTSDACDSTARFTSMYPEWSRLSAVRNNRLYRINADIVARPGPRAVEGLALLISYLHTGRP
jgi:iron complex transport system substrate-binding protein